MPPHLEDWAGTPSNGSEPSVIPTPGVSKEIQSIRSKSTKKDNKKYRAIVIGETQSRVNLMAKIMRKAGFQVETILDEWPEGLYPAIDFEGSMNFNIQWINRKMDQNYIIYDVGYDRIRKYDRSQFYKMEIEQINLRNYPRIGVKPKGD